MLKCRVLLKVIVGSLAPFGLAAMAIAAGPDVLVTDAKIEAGKLVITGKTAAAGTRVRLEGRSETDFNAVSGANKAFRFDLVYLPKDCIVSLQKVQGSQLGAATDAVIANCSPSAITPRGVWNEKTPYQGLDLVSHGGSSWLAMRDRAKGTPGKGGDWQLFAGKGADGQNGSTGSGDGARAADADGRATLIGPNAAPTGPAGGALTGTYPNPGIADNAITATKIAPGGVATGRIANLAVTAPKIGNLAITTAKLGNGAVTGPKIAAGTIDGTHIAPNSITSLHIATDAVQATEIANDSIDSGEIIDFGLSNQDIGVLFAQVNADGTLAASSGSVTSSRISAGTYAVDFGRNVSSCAPIMTQGEAGVGGAAGGITGVTDRSGNANAFFATMRSNANALTDRAFHLVVVC